VPSFKNSPAFYGTRRFNTVFTRARHWSLSLATPSHPISLRSILILYTHLRHGLPSGLVPSGFPTNILYAYCNYPSFKMRRKKVTFGYAQWWWVVSCVEMFLSVDDSIKFLAQGRTSEFQRNTD
jgi:hypothetical protein